MPRFRPLKLSLLDRIQFTGNPGTEEPRKVLFCQCLHPKRYVGKKGLSPALKGRGRNLMRLLHMAGQRS